MKVERKHAEGEDSEWVLSGKWMLWSRCHKSDTDNWVNIEAGNGGFKRDDKENGGW